MALKQEANTEHRKKFHLIRKLEKAVIYARALHGLANNEEVTKCDARTKLETEAYLCFMRGMYNFETSEWKKAAAFLTRCQAIYQKLMQAIADEETLKIYQSRVDELKPTLRYCAFNLGEKDTGHLDILKSGSSLTDEYLVSKLDTLVLQTREKQAATLSEVTWLGKTMTVKHEKIRTFLLLIQDTKGLKVDQWERLLFECRDCLQVLREGTQEKTPLYSYLQYLRYHLTIQRNLVLMETLENNVERIRPYEVIIGCLEDMKGLDLENQGFHPNDSSLFMEKIEAEMMCYKSFRCYCIAKSGRIGWKETVALLHRCCLCITEALDNPVIEKGMKQQLLDLEKKAEADKYTLFAGGIIDGTQD